jgi:ribonucleotide monophosphatase NagD (HAD superfamily)
VPFILLTNGGGKQESERLDELSRVLGVPLDAGMLVQSHTPFEGMVKGINGAEGLRDKCVLVVGGEGGRCRGVAERYVLVLPSFIVLWVY